MHTTYRAMLHGDRLEWTDQVPPELRSDAPVSVYVIITDASPGTGSERGQRMAAALERLAALGGPGAISDPLAWERDLREERPLPDRDR
jgi:hypothetical protein